VVAGQGKAGKECIYIVVFKERGSMFVGDGFNDSDATDFLIFHLYAAMHRELRDLLYTVLSVRVRGEARHTS
jgi:hypothetical protein